MESDRRGRLAMIEDARWLTHRYGAIVWNLGVKLGLEIRLSYGRGHAKPPH